MSDQMILRAAITTLGCRVNQYESDAIAEALTKEGFEIVDFDSQADVYVVNTCTVTAESDRKSRQMIRRASARKNAGVIVTGCFSENNPISAAAIEGVSAVVSNRDKPAVASIARCLALKETVPIPDNTDPYRIFDLNVSRSKRARAYIKIEDGCENKCAYCAIPRARGAIVSRSAKDVLAEAERLIKSGCRELILTGIECAAYGKDLPEGEDLASLILKIDSLPDVERIGLGSLEPGFLRGDFVERISLAKHLLPHFHISLQSGSSSVLARMKRKYSAKQAEDVILGLRKYFPDAMLSADIIVAFPGETEEEFLETVEFCRKHRFLHLHVFPYSQRAGTVAAQMPGQIDKETKRRRSEILIREGNNVRDELLSEYIERHRTSPVYLNTEEIEDGFALGHTEHFVNVALHLEGGFLPSPGDVLPIYPIENKNGVVISSLIPQSK